MKNKILIAFGLLLIGLPAMADGQGTYINYPLGTSFTSITNLPPLCQGSQVSQGLTPTSSNCITVSGGGGGSGTGTVIGTGTINQMAFWVSNSTITSTGNVAFDGTGKILVVASSLTVQSNANFSTTTISQNGAAFSNFYPNAPIQILGNNNGYFQWLLQNQSNGTNASGDIVLTSNLGTDTSQYLDIGINSNRYSNASYSVMIASSGYIYTSDAPLILGANANNLVANNTYIAFFTGAAVSSNTMMTVNQASVTVLANQGLNATYGISAGSFTVTSSSVDLNGISYTLPANSGSANQVLTTNGAAGVLSWGSGGTGASLSANNLWTAPQTYNSSSTFQSTVGIATGTNLIINQTGGLAISLTGSTVAVGGFSRFIDSTSLANIQASTTTNNTASNTIVTFSSMTLSSTTIVMPGQEIHAVFVYNLQGTNTGGTQYICDDSVDPNASHCSGRNSITSNITTAAKRVRLEYIAQFQGSVPGNMQVQIYCTEQTISDANGAGDATGQCATSTKANDKWNPLVSHTWFGACSVTSTGTCDIISGRLWIQ